MRDDLSSQQLELDVILRFKCVAWNLEVVWKRFVVRDIEIKDRICIDLN